MGQFVLLLWKNWTLQKKKKVLTAFEIGLPAFFSLVLLALRQVVTSTEYADPQVWDTFPVESLPLPLVNLSGSSGLDGGKWLVAYTPNSTIMDSVMARVEAKLENISTEAFNTEEELVTYLSNNTVRSSRNILAGVVFTKGVSDSSDPLEDEVSYKLRFKAEHEFGENFNVRIDESSDWFTEHVFPLETTTIPRENETMYGGVPGYYREGFLSLQRAIDMAILKEHNDTADVEDIELLLQRHPYPPYTEDNFVIVIQTQLPFIILLSFIVTAATICKDIVLEKERKLKEYMRMMGLRNWQHWLAWFVKYLVFTLITVVIMTFFLKVNNMVLTNSDATLVFLFLFLYCLTTIFFCFAISTFFSKASSGTAAGAILFLATYFPYFFIANEYEDLTVQSKSAASLLHNVAMAFGCYLIGMYEGRGIGMKWSNFYEPINVNDDFTMLNVLIMLVIDCFIYGCITWYVDGIKPGDYGSPLPFYFPCWKQYWCGSKGDELSTAVDEESGTMDYGRSSAFFEPSPTNTRAGIKIKNLTKEFHKDGQKKVAVDNMTLDMFENQITALLGHNGAGKTTTMFMLTGFLPPTSGTAFINNYSIRRELDKVRGSLGMCPQHNVLFDIMTVKEHLYFFGRLKGIPANMIETEVEHMIKTLNLVEKTDAASKGLSGGMKRKLSVGIALIGNSKVVILDEPSSGMDPQARRELWDILQGQRQGRTMILSTHFMDEADFLGDRIAIMADGQVQCCGTSLFLKGKYGVGYHMVIVKEDGCDVRRVTDIVQHYVPEAELESDIGAELSYVLPRERADKFEGLFEHLEGRKQALGIASFGASVTTMEEVFLKVGETVDQSLERKLKSKESKALNGKDNLGYDNGGFKDLTATNGYEHTARGATAVGVRDPTMPFERNHGMYRLGQQFRALLHKRVIHSWRNKIVTLVQFLLPIAFTLMGCLVIRSFSGPNDPPSLLITMDMFDEPVVPYAVNSTAGSDLATELAEEYANVVDDFSVRKINDDSDYENDPDLIDYLVNVAEGRFSEFVNNYMVAAAFHDIDATSAKVEGLFNNEAYHTPAVTLNNIDNALLRHFAGPGKSIQVENHPLPRSTSTKANEETGTGAVIASILSYNIFFGMCFLIGSFALFIIKERSTKAKHIQFVSGVHITTYWISAFVWDLVNYMAPSLFVIMILACFDIKPYYEGENGGYMILLFLVYGFAVLPSVYLMAFLFNVPSTGYTWVTVINLMLATICLIVVDVLAIPSLNTEEIGDALEWVFLALVPSYCFLAGLRDIYANYENLRVCHELRDEVLVQLDMDPRDTPISDACDILKALDIEVACCPNNCDPDFCVEYQENYLSWEQPGIGKPLVFMSIQFFVFFILLFFFDSGLSKKIRESMTECFMGTNQETPTSEEDHIPLTDQGLEEDSDVKEEHSRIVNTPVEQLKTTDSLLLAELKKYYGNFLAVNNLTLGVPDGECFGLLGVNGAGKTTTFKMLTGDETLSGGDAWLEGYSVKSQIKQAQQRMGYCPQFDALIDQMTVRETLLMYGRLRGIQESYLEQVVSNHIASLLLEDHEHKRTSDLSGGNKRKLSTAIALIGDPPIVFLDEPTTGMDPVARRLLWDTLTKVRATGRTLVLTSHSMEECEALCTRLAIMVNGQFKCLGSTQMLKSKFGDGYTLIAKIRPGQYHDVETQTMQLMTFIEETFAGSTLKDKHQGYVHYHIGSGSKGWAEIFGIMERAKERYSLEDYSVSQTTLEQVFLNFARAQRPPRDTKMTTTMKCRNCCNFIFCCGCCGSRVSSSVSPERVSRAETGIIANKYY